MDNGACSYRRFRDDGDESGLAELIITYRDGLILYLNSFVGDLSVAEDLAEDTFARLCIKKPRHNGKASFKTWLYTIGRNLALNYIRQNAKRVQVSLEQLPHLSSDEENLEIAYIKKEEKITVHRALRSLKPQYRQILWLVYFENFSLKEAAGIMKKSVHSVETLVYRARKSLGSQLEMEGFLYEEL